MQNFKQRQFKRLQPYIVGYKKSRPSFIELYIENYHGINKDNANKVDCMCVYCGSDNVTHSISGSLASKNMSSLDYISTQCSFYCAECGQLNNSHDELQIEMQCGCCDGYFIYEEKSSHLYGALDWYLSHIKQSKNGLHVHPVFKDWPECIADYEYPLIDGLAIKYSR